MIEGVTMSLWVRKFILLVPVLLGAAFLYLQYGKEVGVGLFLFSAMVILSISIFGLKLNNGNMVFLIAPVALPALFFSFMVFVRDNTLLTHLNVVATVLLIFLLTVILASGKSIKNFKLTEYMLVPLIFVDFFEHAFKIKFDIVRNLTGIKLRNTNKNTKRQITGGLTAAVLAVMFLVYMFSSADLIFQHYVHESLGVFRTISFSTDILWQTVVLALITTFFVGIFNYIFKRKTMDWITSQVQPQDGRRKLRVEYLEAYIVLVAVNITFALFIFVQITYFFGAYVGTLPADFTHAEYARKGFFELLAVAAFVFAVLFGADEYMNKTSETKQAAYFKALSSVLIIQTMIVIVSSFQRLSLYEQEFGFTTLRVWTHAFTIFLAILFTILLFKILTEKKERFLALGVFISIVLFLGTMNIFNPDKFIAQKNIERYKKTGKIDTEYLTYLSDDAVPILYNISIGGFEIRNQEQQRDNQWQSANVSRINAKKLISDYRK